MLCMIDGNFQGHRRLPESYQTIKPLVFHTINSCVKTHDWRLLAAEFMAAQAGCCEFINDPIEMIWGRPMCRPFEKLNFVQSHSGHMYYEMMFCIEHLSRWALLDLAHESTDQVYAWDVPCVNNDLPNIDDSFASGGETTGKSWM